MKSPLHVRCERLVCRLGLADAVLDVRPLDGGVSSDIAMVSLPGRRVCVKFALPVLRTAERWEAPVERNVAECAWLSFAASAVPENVPALLGRADDGFAMECVDGDDVRSWKRSLLAGTGNPKAEAGRVGDVLGRVHACSTDGGFERGPFDNLEVFDALRIDPYLRFTASRHPALATPLLSLAEALRTIDGVLIHGDVSPKNILFRGDEPVLLDAECATVGDAAFDVAFCLVHLTLKAVHLPGSCASLLDAAEALWRAYARHVSWEDVRSLESRVAALLPALMLARVDGKSPVEYLSSHEQERVRQLASAALARPSARLAELYGPLRTAASDEV